MFLKLTICQNINEEPTVAITGQTSVFYTVMLLRECGVKGAVTRFLGHLLLVHLINKV